MKGLNKREVLTNNKGVESKEGERKRLFSNDVNTRSPSLEFNPNNDFVSEDVALDYLASILADILIHHQQ